MALYVGMVAVALCLTLLLIVVVLVYRRRKGSLDADVADSSILTTGFQPMGVKPTKPGVWAPHRPPRSSRLTLPIPFYHPSHTMRLVVVLVAIVVGVGVDVVIVLCLLRWWSHIATSRLKWTPCNHVLCPLYRFSVGSCVVVCWSGFLGVSKRSRRFDMLYIMCCTYFLFFNGIMLCLCCSSWCYKVEIDTGMAS